MRRKAEIKANIFIIILKICSFRNFINKFPRIIPNKIIIKIVPNSKL